MKNYSLKKVSVKFVMLCQNVYKSAYSRCKECGNVWMFHLVSDEDEVKYEEDFTIKKNNFSELIQNTKEKGGRFKSVDELNIATDKDIFITFDDGFKEIYTVVYPILKEYDVPFIVFVTVEFIDREGYLTKEELLEISRDNLCTIGSHTLTHPRLKTVGKDIAITEIQQSKLRLEELIQKPVKYFAYPYGDFFSVSKREQRIVKECGYKYAFSTIQMALNKNVIKKAMYIPRKNVNDDNYREMG